LDTISPENTGWHGDCVVIASRRLDRFPGLLRRSESSLVQRSQAMSNRPIRTSLFAALAATGLLLGACSETPQETREDVAAAQRKAAEKVAETRASEAKDVAGAREELVETTQEAVKDINAAAADTREDMADARDDLADASTDAAKAINEERADLTREQADANFQIAIAKAEGDLKVAKERCDALTGEAESNCNATAKAEFEQRKSDAELALQRWEQIADTTADQPPG
jgi:hypothetical protein